MRSLPVMRLRSSKTMLSGQPTSFTWYRKTTPVQYRLRAYAIFASGMPVTFAESMSGKLGCARRAEVYATHRAHRPEDT